MILDSFKLYNAIIQFQYEDSYVLWDRAGDTCRQLSKIWPGVKLRDTQPNQQVLSGSGVNIQTNISKSTITLSGESALSQPAIRKIEETFEVWRKNLEIETLLRVSTRVVYLKDFSSLKKANAELFAMNLVRWPSSKVFDQPMDTELNGVEVQYRFEDEKSFSVLRLKAEQLNFSMELDPYWVEEAEIKKEKNRLVIDFDRGLLAAVNAEKFRIDEWLKGYQHVLRRDLEKVLGSAQ